jgi:hypothetical protein
LSVSLPLLRSDCLSSFRQKTVDYLPAAAPKITRGCVCRHVNGSTQ